MTRRKGQEIRIFEPALKKFTGYLRYQRSLDWRLLSGKLLLLCKILLIQLVADIVADPGDRRGNDEL